MKSPFLPYLWYPLAFGCAVLAFSAMLGAGVPLILAAYLPIIAVASAIILLELRFPERLNWRPTWSDVSADAAFMAFVQVVLPRGLAVVSVFFISGWLHDHAPSSLWPHSWPLAAQVLTMVLIVDFVRYWLHRACHRFDFLWRLHEVHHSPDILYSLNVGRFHPLEKLLHFSLDTVPFMLLGVAPEVIAGYFLLYSVNGFFQHSNIRLSYGWLNYLVGSAETHRWHHSTDPKIASCNFGNTTIIWDMLFGTWYLPAGKTVDDIGIMNKAYPKHFWAQMVAPFNGGESNLRRRTWRIRIADLSITLNLRILRFVQGRKISRAARDPMALQHALLARIVKENRDTTFGRRHGFSQIRDYDDFRRLLPVSDYEMLRPYVDAEIQSGEPALTKEAPVQYVRTSGTTGKAKDIPLTRTHLKALRRIQRASVALQHRACPEAFSGGILAVVSPAFEGMLANGKPFGSASGIVAGNTPSVVLEKFVLPPQVLTIADSRVKYLLILRLALAWPDITYIGAANSSTLLTLMKLYREHESILIDDIRQGSFFLLDRIPQDVLSVIRPRLVASPDRADQLSLLAKTEEVRMADLWPAARMVVTWTCASAGIAVDALRRELSDRIRVLELGYVSSEFRGTITLGLRAGSGLPTLDTHFFEFVEREKWDAGQAEFLTLGQLRKGIDYYILVTTPSGLYRYFINDLIRVRGFLYKMPLFKFMQKGKGVTNITGEKLYESQVLAAVRTVAAEFGLSSRFVMMLADEEERGYRLYVETESAGNPAAELLSVHVDEKLCALNVEYSAKRESERLGALHATWLKPGALDAYKQFCVAQGQREGQFKTVALAYRKTFSFDLDAWGEDC